MFLRYMYVNVRKKIQKKTHETSKGLSSSEGGLVIRRFLLYLHLKYTVKKLTKNAKHHNMKEIIYYIYTLKEKEKKGIPWQFSCQDFSTFTAEDSGSIPGQGTKISKAAQHGQRENSRKGRKGGRERRKKGGRERGRSKRVNGYQGLSHSVKEIEHHLYCEDLWGPLNDCFPLLTQKNNY